MRRSLGTKIGVLFAVFMAVASSVAGVTATRQMSEMTHQAALLEGHAVLDALAIPAAVAIATHDYTKLDNFVAELERSDSNDVMIILVLDRDGRLMATSKTGFVGAGVHDFAPEFVDRALAAPRSWYAFGPTREAPEHLDIAMAIHQGQRWGTLLARFTLGPLNASLARLERWTMVLTVLTALAGWIIAYLLLRSLVIEPTRRLADMAQRIGKNELTLRNGIRGDDEIGALGRSLDAMAERLEAYTTELESAVAARTRELEVANRALATANVELERLATTDGLTGLRNHRYFKNTLEFELKRGARRVHPLSLCMLDIDYFKKFNDTHGHPAGDEVLRRVGALLVEHLRSTDVVARYGGEEFAVILLDTPPDEGFRTAQKIGQIFRENRFDGEHTQPNGKLTVSVGLASYPEDANSAEGLVRAADLALYEAKRRGRNTVVRYTVEIPQHTGLTSELPLVDPLARDG